MSRTATTITGLAQRAASTRRQQRRPMGRRDGPALYCRTNGCTTFMRFDATTGLATCPVCGASRRLA